ncbi:MAG: serine/threonine-protein kinase [Cyanobacteria bacterium J06639_18]
MHHPQVPQFREQFEQSHRLFLVQDYVAGKNYRTLLEERQANGNGKFTEEEVLHLLNFLLPILGYIHSQRIIHRDISPDNIILRERDRLPVLIDFGVVKEIATQIQSPDKIAQVTTVGKLGYSPSEQMQAGAAYPSSDLYALAVTAIVLLTGKEPSELFDETQAAWNWEKQVTVNPLFARVLNRMLSYRPSERYGNAAEVVRALQVLNPHAGSQTTGLQTQKGVSPSNPDLSQMRTIAVGRPPEESRSSTGIPSSKKHKPRANTNNSSNSSILDSPLAIFIIVFTVAIFAGFGSWALVSFLLQNKNTESQTVTPQAFPSPIVSKTPTPTPTVTFEDKEPEDEKPVENTTKTKRLVFDIQDKAEVRGRIKDNELIQYIFFAKVDQNFTALVSEHSGVVMTVLAPNGEPIDTGGLEVFVQARLPSSGRYVIQLKTAQGISESDYQLKVELEKAVKTIPEQPITEETPSTEDTLREPVTGDPTQEPSTESENIPTESTTEDDTEKSPGQFPSENPDRDPSFPIDTETDRNTENDSVNSQTDTEQESEDGERELDDD